MLLLKPSTSCYINLHRSPNDQFHITRDNWRTALITALSYGWVPRYNVASYLKPAGQQITSADSYSLGVALCRSVIDTDRKAAQRVALLNDLATKRFHWFCEDEALIVTGLIKFCERGAFRIDILSEDSLAT